MAVLRPEVLFKFDGLQKLAQIFPDLNSRFLALIGKRARVLLKEQYLSGQEIDLRAFPKDRAGRYTISSSINKRRTHTTISSYPMNLFERGRKLRSGAREAGKFVITKKLKQDVMSKSAGYTREFENRILEPEINDLGLG